MDQVGAWEIILVAQIRHRAQAPATAEVSGEDSVLISTGEFVHLVEDVNSITGVPSAIDMDTERIIVAELVMGNLGETSITTTITTVGMDLGTRKNGTIIMIREKSNISQVQKTQ